jgi:hypothetical protein
LKRKLHAVQALHSAPHWDALRADRKSALLHRITECVTLQFRNAAAELLDTIAKTQASLSKLGRMRGNTSLSTEGGMTDIEKIQKQLCLDVLEYGNHIEKLTGKPPRDLVSFVQLLSLVQQHVGVSTSGPLSTGSTGRPSTSALGYAVGFSGDLEQTAVPVHSDRAHANEFPSVQNGNNLLQYEGNSLHENASDVDHVRHGTRHADVGTA